jgi:hypothetical protein
LTDEASSACAALFALSALAARGTVPKVDSFASIPCTASGAMFFDFTWFGFSFTAA